VTLTVTPASGPVETVAFGFSSDGSSRSGTRVARTISNAAAGADDVGAREPSVAAVFVQASRFEF
jgi:hypothetical protein